MQYYLCMYERLLHPVRAKVQRSDSSYFVVLHYLLLSVSMFSSAYIWNHVFLDISLHVQCYTGEDTSRLLFMDSVGGQ